MEVKIQSCFPNSNGRSLKANTQNQHMTLPSVKSSPSVGNDQWNNGLCVSHLTHLGGQMELLL